MKGLRITLAAGVAAAIACASVPAHADADSGVAAGVRTGFGIPLGSARDGQTLATLEGGMLPVWFDLGYRFNPNWLVGAFFQYGITAPPNSGCGVGKSCDGNDIRFGLQVHYHLMPKKFFDPWVGLGVGYETTQIHTAVNADGDETTLTMHGVQFVDLQLGGDLRVSDRIPFGPFVDFSLGQFSGGSLTDARGGKSTADFKSAMHEWLTVGFRAQFNL